MTSNVAVIIIIIIIIIIGIFIFLSEKPRRKRKEKKERDENKPKRPAVAFMLWLNNAREKIKSENPGISVTEIAKKGGEMWKEINDKSEWEDKANKLKKRYTEAMKTYEARNSAKTHREKISKAAKSERKKNKREASSSSSSSSSKAAISPSKTE